jgi:lysylphosphatidylglycerol synthetase-like protein (DUF2156 family)
VPRKRDAERSRWPAGRDDRDMASEVERARQLVLAHGWNATAYQILNPGMELWFAAAGDAVIGFVRSGRTRVVGGAPICANERLRDVAAAFERDAATQGESVCYFAAEARLGALPRAGRPYATLLLGAQPVWRPEQLLAAFRDHASLRAQLHRARNKGIDVAEWPCERAARDAALRRCLAQWLRTRGLPALHFLVETATLDALLDRRIFVASRTGQPVAFLIATPIPARSGWLVEHIVRGAGASNGTSELLLEAAALAAATAGVELITLGLAPLSVQLPAAPVPPRAVRIVLTWLRAHGRRFYDFAGLEAFKAKFRPERWEPVYALATSPRVSLRPLLAIARAFGHGSLLCFGACAVARAVGRELQTLRRGWRRRTAPRAR